MSDIQVDSLRNQVELLRALRHTETQPTIVIPDDAGLEVVLQIAESLIQEYDLKTPVLLPAERGGVRAEWHGRDGMLSIDLDTVRGTASMRLEDHLGHLRMTRQCGIDHQQIIAEFVTLMRPPIARR